MEDDLCPNLANRLIFKEVLNERREQDKQWGGPAHDDQHDTYDWAGFIRKQLEKIDVLAVNRAERRQHFVKVAALAFAALESLDRKQDARRTNSQPPEFYRFGDGHVIHFPSETCVRCGHTKTVIEAMPTPCNRPVTVFP